MVLLRRIRSFLPMVAAALALIALPAFAAEVQNAQPDPALADEYHVAAPDYPGFGHSSAPAVEDSEYAFDNLVTVVEKFTEEFGLEKYSISLMDYGAQVGFRLDVRHPERVEALTVQNGNAQPTPRLEQAHGRLWPCR